jgi:hypothetical protein
MNRTNPGPSPSERLLFQLWDAVDAARLREGEQAAEQLAAKALKAIQPTTEPPRTEAAGGPGRPSPAG